MAQITSCARCALQLFSLWQRVARSSILLVLWQPGLLTLLDPQQMLDPNNMLDSWTCQTLLSGCLAYHHASGIHVRASLCANAVLSLIVL